MQFDVRNRKVFSVIPRNCQHFLSVTKLKVSARVTRFSFIMMQVSIFVNVSGTVLRIITTLPVSKDSLNWTREHSVVKFVSSKFLT